MVREMKNPMYTLPAGVAVADVPPGSPGQAFTLQESVYVASRENSLRRVVEQMPGIVWTTDLDLNITFSLGNGLSRLNTMAQPYEGMPLSEFFSDESVHSPLLDAHHNALGGHAQSFELEANGVVFWGVVEPLFNADWTLIGTVGNAMEITNLKETDVERFREVVRMHETGRRRALYNLATGVTQHFTRLFNAVSAYAAIVGMGLPAEHPGRRWIDAIEKAANCAQDLTEQLLEPKPGHQRSERVHLTQLITDHLETFQALLSKKVTFQVDLEEENFAIAADPDEIRRLLVTLLYNASTSIGDEEGTITLRTQITKGPPWPLFDQDADTQLPEGDYLWLQVSDTGVGLDDESRARIFEPFAGFSGRGLGMGAVMGVVTALRGALSISSKPGLGTTCHVFLPVVPNSTAMPQAPECFF